MLSSKIFACLAFIANVFAFVPSTSRIVQCSTKMSYENAIGAQPPLGIGLIKRYITNLLLIQRVLLYVNITLKNINWILKKNVFVTIFDNYRYSIRITSKIIVKICIVPKLSTACVLFSLFCAPHQKIYKRNSNTSLIYITILSTKVKLLVQMMPYSLIFCIILCNF